MGRTWREAVLVALLATACGRAAEPVHVEVVSGADVSAYSDRYTAHAIDEASDPHLWRELASVCDAIDAGDLRSVAEAGGGAYWVRTESRVGIDEGDDLLAVRSGNGWKVLARTSWVH